MSMFSRTRRSTRLALTAGVASALTLGLAACGGSSNSGGGSGSKTITVQVQAGAEKQFAGFIKVFEKQNPGAKVKTTSVAQTAKTGSNLTVLTSTNAPDVGIIPTNTQVYSRMLAAKQLVPLDDVWKNADLDKGYGADLAPSLKSDGTPYVVSYDRTFYNIVYYNKAMFKQLRITEPPNHRVGSIADLTKITRALKAGGKQGLAIGPADNYQSSWMIDSFLQTSASAEEYANYLSSWQPSVPVTAKYTDPAFVAALSQVQAMGKANVFQDGYLGQKVVQSESLFLQGKAGMLLDGQYTVAVLMGQGLKFDLGWMLLPPTDSSKKTEISLYTGDTLAIPQKAANKPLAKKFLQAVMSVEGQSTQIAAGSLPSINSIPASSYKALSPVVQAQLAHVSANGAQVGWTSGVPGGLGQQFTDPMVQSMLNGKASPEDIAKKVQDQLAVTRSGK